MVEKQSRDVIGFRASSPVEVKRLSHLVVEKMFRHAQQHDIELIPPYTIGFLCGLREAELWRLQYSNIVISESEKHVIVPAAISKVKKKRIIPLSDNAVSWMQWYFHHARKDILPEGDELPMSKWHPNKLCDHRQANYEAAAGEGAKWPQNCKRHAFASHYAALLREARISGNQTNGPYRNRLDLSTLCWRGYP